MSDTQEEEELLRSVALQNAQSILLARRRAEEELVHAKQALERNAEELARSLSMMRATLESTTDAILATDADGRITCYNHNYTEMWQIPGTVIETCDHAQLLNHILPQLQDSDSLRERIDAIYTEWPAETYDLLKTIDGRVVERFSRIQRIGDRKVGRVWSFRDITERVKAEDALRDETSVLELLNDTGKAIASNLDLQSLVQTVTDAATKLCGAKFGAFFYNVTGSDGEKLILYTLSGAPREAFEKFGLPRNTPVFNPTFRGDGPVRSDDITKDPRYGTMPPHHGMPKGHLPVCSYLAVSVISRSGEVIGGLFFGHPRPAMFSERDERLVLGVAAQAAVAIDNARLYESAQKASMAKTAFLTNMSHELRTPLNAIIGYAEMLSDDVQVLGNPAMSNDLDKIHQAGRHLLSLINDVLDLSKIEAGKMELSITKFEVQHVVDEVVATLATLISKNGNALTVDSPDSLGSMQSDEMKIRQVLFNLLSNATKFTENGSIKLSVRREDDSTQEWIVFEIADTGIGMSPDESTLLFRDFTQVDSSSTRRHEGTGLGLSISQRFCRMMGGDITVQSEKGKGSIFTCRLPAVMNPAI